MRATSRLLTLALIALAVTAWTTGPSNSSSTQSKSDDRDQITRLSAEAAEGDWLEQRQAISDLAENHGAYAVNGLLRWIGGRADVENRVRAIFALRRLGPGAEPAFLAGLHSDDPMVRRNLCLVLAEVGSSRSIPSLVRVAQHDADPLAQEQARAALANLGAAPALQGGGSAADLLADLALACASGAQSPSADEDGSQVFFWNGREIAHKAVSEALYPHAYARLFAEDALRLEPGNQRAQEALLAAYRGMHEAIAAGGDEEWNDDLAAISDLLALGGVTLAEEEGGESEPEADSDTATLAGASDLIRSDDKRLRYKAALSLAGPEASSEVIEVLAAALSESSIRQILVVDNDVTELNQILSQLNERGTSAVGALTGAQGLVRAKATPVKDVVILRSTLTDLAADQVIRALSRDVRTQDVPVIVIGSEGEQERLEALLGDQVVSVVPAPVNRAVLQPALDAAFEQVQFNEQRLAAEDFSRRAAEALARMDAGSLSAVSDALVAAIGRDDSIQIPALRALQKVGAPGGEAPAAALFSDETASTEARVAAAGALEGILARHGAAPGTLAALQDALSGDDPALKSAAARVLGVARSVSTEDRTALLLEHGITY